MSSPKILFVDDEDFVLQAICRFFRDIYTVQTASSADAALEILTHDRSFAVVVADVRMPGMSGIDFLRYAHDFAPHTTRVLLTGQLSTEDSLRAVNEGHVFQILMKPCPVGVMHSALDAAVRYYQSSHNRMLELEQSEAKSTVKLLCEILAMVSPAAARRALRLKTLASSVAKQMGAECQYEIETTALLSQFGCIGIPSRVLSTYGTPAGKRTGADAECFEEHAAIAAQLLREIPQLGECARSIELQFKNFDGTGRPAVDLSGEAIPLPARILRAVSEFEMYTEQNMSPRDAIATMIREAHHYDPKVMHAIKELHHVKEVVQELELNVNDIQIGMILERAVGTTDGRTLLAKGSQVTESMLARLRAFASKGSIIEPILVSGQFPSVSYAPPGEPVVIRSEPAQAQ